MIEWKDATSYSRGERGSKPPTAWEATIEGARIFVMCGHISHKGEWVVRCDMLGIDLEHLGAVDEMTAEGAREDAVKFVVRAAERRLDHLKRLVDRLRFENAI